MPQGGRERKTRTSGTSLRAPRRNRRDSNSRACVPKAPCFLFFLAFFFSFSPFLFFSSPCALWLGWVPTYFFSPPCSYIVCARPRRSPVLSSRHPYPPTLPLFFFYPRTTGTTAAPGLENQPGLDRQMSGRAGWKTRGATTTQVVAGP